MLSTSGQGKSRFASFTAAHPGKNFPSDHAKPLVQKRSVFIFALRTHNERLIFFEPSNHNLRVDKRRRRRFPTRNSGSVSSRPHRPASPPYKSGHCLPLLVRSAVREAFGCQLVLFANWSRGGSWPEEHQTAKAHYLFCT